MARTNLSYQQNTQTLIGERKRNLQDLDTGEVIQVDQIVKRIYGTKQFWKVYLMDFLSVLGIIDSRQLDVFIYIAENTDPGNNLFIGTYDKIGKETGVSRQTISRIMRKLQDKNFIVKVQQGVWAVNPNILMKGNDHKRQILLSYYENTIPETSVEISRGQRPALDEIPGQLSINFRSGEIEEDTSK